MKKNVNKWLVIAIVLMGLIIVGNIMNIGGASAKEVEEPEKERMVIIYVMHEEETFDEAYSFLINGMDLEGYTIGETEDYGSYLIRYYSNDETELALQYGYVE